MDFDLLASLMDSALLYRLYDNLLHFKFNRKLRYLSGVAAMAILVLRYVICMNMSDSNVYIVRILFNLAIFIIAFVFYSDKFRKKILMGFIYFVIMLISESVVMIILTISTQQTVDYVVQNNEALRQASIVISKLISVYLIEQLIVRFRKYNDVSFNYMKELSLILLINFVLFAVAVLAITTPTSANSNYKILLIMTIGVTFVSIMSTFLISKVGQKSRKEMEYQLELSQLEMEHKYYEDMSDLVNYLRSLRHDMNNHIGIMLGLVDTEQYDDLRDYLKDIYADASHANDYIFLEDKTLTILLNTKIGKASALNLDMVIDVNAPSLPFNMKDMSTIIGNMLDNAIEAAAQVDVDPYISFSIELEDNLYTISCINNYKSLPKEHNGKYLTSKDDAKNHGMGIANIQSAVERYKGAVTINVSEVFEMIVQVDANAKS